MNWKQRIERAEKRGAFSGKDRALARGWGQCTVGEYHGQYNTNTAPWAIGVVGYPADRKLDAWGWEFFVAVTDDDVTHARKLHGLIAKRMTRLPKASQP